MNKRRQKEGSTLKDNLARSIAEKIVAAQHKASYRLSGWEQKCSPFQIKVVFFVFILMSGGYCSYVLIDALTRREASQRKYPVPHPITPIADSMPVKQDPFIAPEPLQGFDEIK